MSNEELQAQRDLLEIELQRMQNQQNLKQSFKDQTKDLKTLFDYQKKSKLIEVEVQLAKNKILAYQKEINKLEKDSSDEAKKSLASYKDKLNAESRTVEFREKELRLLNSNKALGTAILNNTKKIADQAGKVGLSFSQIYDFLMESDKAILNVSKNMGLSGANADRFRDSLNQSAQFAARMGVSVGELAEAQADFAEKTGKVSSLSGEALRNIVAIGKGTALGVAGASELASNFDMVGKSAMETRNFVQDTLDKSERMGVNAGKVLKNVNANFKQAQKFNFKGGVNGLADMAINAEKMRIDIQDTFKSAEISKTLEGAIKTSAKLQVLGGRFANFDPLRMLNLARNNVKEYQKELNGMLKGIANFDSKTGEFGITPEDLQRLDLVAEATGQNVDNLIEQAKKRAQIDKMQSSLVGKTKEQKDLLEQIAVYSKEKGGFVVDINGEAKDIRSLNAEQLKSLQAGKDSLEQRAQNAQTFDEQFKNTIMELKSSLLPLLKYVNDALKWFNGIIGQADDTGNSFWKNISGAIVKFAGLGAVFLLFTGKLGGITKSLGSIIGGLAKGGLKAIGGAIGLGKGGGGGAVDAIGGGADKLGSSLKAVDTKTILSKAASLLALGAAIVLISSGIWITSKAIETLANTIKGLDDKQLKVLGIAFASLIGSIIILAALGSVVGAPLLAIGAGIALIGLGIGVASAGIGFMAEGLSKLTNPNIATNLLGISAGLLGISASALLLGNPLSLLGLGAMAIFLNSLPSGNDFTNMKLAFDSANTFLNAPVENLNTLKNLIDSIASSESNPISQLSSLIGDGLTVKFDKDVQMNVTTEINLDGNQIAKTTATKVVKVVQSKQQGKG